MLSLLSVCRQAEAVPGKRVGWVFMGDNVSHYIRPLHQTVWMLVGCLSVFKSELQHFKLIYMNLGPIEMNTVSN